MENNLNKQNNLISNMKKILILITLMLVSLMSVNAYENPLLNYQFENVGGTIAYDISGNGINSNLIGGSSIVTTNPLKWDASVLLCNANGQYTQTISTFTMPNKYTISFWAVGKGGGTLQDTFFHIKGTGNNYLELYYDWTGNVLTLEYKDVFGNLKTKNIDNFVLSNSVYNHYVIEIDSELGTMSYYMNNVQKLNDVTLTGGIAWNSTEPNTMFLCVENSLNVNTTFSGRIDSFTMFNFLATESQVNQLNTLNSISYNQTTTYNATLNETGTTNIVNVQLSNNIVDTTNINNTNTNINNLNSSSSSSSSSNNDVNITTMLNNSNSLNQNQSMNLIINNYMYAQNGNVTNKTFTKSNLISFMYPLSNESKTKFDNIEVGLNHKAICQFYYDYNLVYTSSQEVYSFTYPLEESELKEHNYLVACSYEENNNIYYDVSNLTKFNLVAPMKTINFYVYNQTNDLMRDKDLYLVTPCPQDREMSSYWILERPFYVQKVNNGYASYNLSYNAEYEFCLLKGRVNYDVNNYSMKVNFANVDKETKLGIMYVTGDTLNYNLGLTNADLYGVAQPEFWGKTWQSLFTLILALALGGLFIFIGIKVESKILVYIGGVIVAGGLGISVGGLIIGGLFN